ncbi:MAG: extracellular solute-binding protein [Chloroflexi bacterium]|nr:extracellular solute-binding protein [Chloroflexota bacterium]
MSQTVMSVGFAPAAIETSGRQLSRRAMVRTSSGAAVTAAAAAVIASCAGPESGGPAKVAGKPATIIWAVRGGGTPEGREALLQEYKQVQPLATIEQFDASGGIAPSIEKLAAGLASGLPIDFINGHLAARQLIESIDLVQPVDDLVKRDRFNLSKYNQAALESTGKYDGKLYTLPYAYGGDVAAVAYNKTLFRQAGVKEPSSDWSKPWTWDEFREAMRRLTKSEGSTLTQVGAAGFGYWVHTAIMQWGATWLKPDYKTVVCDSQQTIDAYAKYTDLLFKDRVLAQSPGASLGSGNAFLNGKAAVDMPCCYAARFAKNTKGPNIEWAFITMPKGTVSSLDVSPVIMGLAKSSKQRNEAWEFLKFLDDKSRLAAVEDRIPAVIPDIMPWIKQNFAEWPDSRAEMLAEGMRVAKPLEPLRYHPQWQRIVQEVLDPGWKEVREQTKTMTDMLRASKPLIQNIVDEHARSRRK